MVIEPIREGLTFDDVLIVPSRSSIVPAEADVTARFSRNIGLQIPVVSAAMDTVTKSAMAIALAQHGGMGIIHRNMPIENQAEEVDKVKRHESGMIHDPISMRPSDKIYQAKEVMQKYHISGLPITDASNRLVGILTNRDIRFETRTHLPIEQSMTKDLITVPVGTSLEEAETLFHKHKIEKILVVDDGHHLKGMITYKDILKRIQYPNAAKDGLGRLRVGAAVGVGEDALDTPVIFAQVYDPVDAGIARNWTSSGNNTTGTSTKIPVAKIMDVLKQLAPVKKMAVLYAPDEKNSESQLRDIVANFRSDQSIKITPVPLAKMQEIDKVLPLVLRSVDALYITGSIFVNSRIEQIAAMAVKAHVLTVSHLDDMVQKGVLLGVCANSYQVGRLAGEKGVRIMHGDRPSSIPIESPKQFDVIVNLKTADNGRFSLPNTFTRTVTKTIR